MFKDIGIIYPDIEKAIAEVMAVHGDFRVAHADEIVRGPFVSIKPQGDQLFILECINYIGEKKYVSSFTFGVPF